MKGGARWIGFEAASVPHVWSVDIRLNLMRSTRFDADAGWMHRTSPADSVDST
jgi:hypothetical protein